jgi:alkanesulfonate monooxygenase SsuD/methylene tetrahydromethanopterin reductase-like flavin-dependent oxidoreductase (luciferase family)
MLIGTILNIPGEEGRSDAAVVREYLALGDLVEPLGFDSLFVLEHHFSSYVLSPAPFQTLAFFAGRTSRIILGTAVVVLPWHDPVRVAEEIAVLDILCDGRCVFAFGRGRGQAEYNGFRVPMEESRGRFTEAAEIVWGALEHEVFEYTGRYYQIPPISIRPRATSQPQRRFYGSAMGTESAELVARLGFGILTSTQKPWAALGEDITRFCQFATTAHHEHKPPIVLAGVSVAKSREEARERAERYLGRESLNTDRHYRFSAGQLGRIKGYEAYAATGQEFARLRDPAFFRQATAAYLELQLIGTPRECISQIHELQEVTGCEHLILEFSYGGMPFKDVEANMRMFAAEVLPAFHLGVSAESSALR